MSEDFDIEQAPDRISTRPIAITIGVAVVVVVVSAILPGAVIEPPSRAQKDAQSAAGRPEISEVEQTATPETSRGSTLRAAQEQALSHYGWVDREHGVVRIPIEQAMQLVEEKP